jgi:hypothetical protein
LIERSKEMSGESLRAMMVRGFSTVTSVRIGAGSRQVPAVEGRLALDRLVAAIRIGVAATAAPALALDRVVGAQVRPAALDIDRRRNDRPGPCRVSLCFSETDRRHAGLLES